MWSSRGRIYSAVLQLLLRLLDWNATLGLPPNVCFRPKADIWRRAAWISFIKHSRVAASREVGYAHAMRRYSLASITYIIVSAALAAATFRAVAAEPARAQWVTLGTAGGPRVHADQAQIANALVVGEAVYLFDTGNGVLRQMAAARLPVRNVRAIFISHHHVDHNADAGPLMIATWMFGGGKRVAVYGPDGTSHLVKGLAAAN